MTRTLGIAFGIGTHVLFAFTVWHLYWFLSGYDPGPSGGSLWIDVGLALTFAVPHSALLHPIVRHKLTEYISAPFYGLMFCCATSASLLTTIFCWQPAGTVWWSLEGPARIAVNLAYYGSWVLLLYSIRLNGFGYQTGWTPWSYWLRRRPIPPRPFEPRSLYRYLRHPVYLSFLGLVWFTPVMTADRAILLGVWTLYIFVGSWLKDLRLAYSIGDRYREYQSRVPGYPGMLIGPLARIPFEPPMEVASPAKRQAA